MLTAPYVTPAAFRAHPTFLESKNLRVGDLSLADQDTELANILLEASAWADNQTNQQLGARTVTENARLTPNRGGALIWRPSETPVRAVTALSWGYQSNRLAALADLTGIWIERGSRVVAPVAPLSGAWADLQFGGPAAGTEVFTTWTYVAGYTSTVLATDTAAGANAVSVADPAGIYPRDVLRIWEPGVEEAVTVAAGYLPGQTTVPLTATTANAHTTGAGVSGLPADVHLAVVLYTVALLLRPSTVQNVSFPRDNTGGPGASGGKTAAKATDGPSFAAQAARLLASYARVR